MRICMDSAVYNPAVNSIIIFSAVRSGFDHNFVIWPTNANTVGQNRFVARSVHPKSGRSLDVYSNQPGVQFYTGITI
jgi:aldose 1-epimerase